MGPQSVFVLPIDSLLPVLIPIFLYLSSLLAKFFADFKLILGSYPALFRMGEPTMSVYWTLAQRSLHEILNCILIDGYMLGLIDEYNFFKNGIFPT